jgi:mannose-6-phosphate isomerase-like protein (cupin superfamily)
MKENNINKILKDDGVDQSKIDINEFVNLNSVSLEKIKKKFGKAPWASRVAFNDRFGAVLICQNPGEGNRKHYHPDADECWFIVEGEWEWFIEGTGVKKVKANDIVVVPKKTPHQIKCVGTKPGIRLAITKADVDHVYVK